MKELDAIQRELLLEGLDDFVGLWEVATIVRASLGDVSPDLIRDTSMRSVRPLLLGGYWAAGDSPYATKNKFREWDVSGEEAAERINREWRQLGKDPDLLEICWFKNTALGNKVATALSK